MDAPLPLFRADLEVYLGPEDLDDASATYSVYDPLRAQYFKLSWAEASILKQFRPGMTLNDLLDAIAKNTTLKVTEGEVRAFFIQAEEQGLLETRKSSEQLIKEEEKKKVSFLKWLIMNYLFIRIPLVNPDVFLTKTLPWALPFFSPQAVVLYALAGLWGFVVLLVRGAEFLSTFPYFFNLKGVVAYSVAIICAKVIHELSHAYTAKKYGLRVPSMGIAFLVLWPVLYTDATDAWRLHDRKKRLLISGAGVIAELVLAGLATIGWAFTKPGILHSVFFVIASANWLTSLAININPALRFDGYYLLSDFWGIENLQNRAFNLTRREGYRVLAGIEFPHPEPQMQPRRQRALIIYSIYTWIYRIFLYTAIALFVYFKFTKILGAFLFFAEIIIFFVWPIAHEVNILMKIRHKLAWNRRVKTTLGILAFFLLWGVFPWPYAITVPAVTVPVDQQVIYSPSAGKITDIYVERGTLVQEDQPLLRIQSHELQTQIAILQKEQAILQKKLDVIQESEELLPLYLETQAELSQAIAELEALQQQNRQNLIKAKTKGHIYAWDDMLHVEQYLEKDQILGQLAAANKLDVMGFVPENAIDAIHIGQTVRFLSFATREKVRGTVTQISPVRAASLAYPQLASLYGGDLPTTKEENDQLSLLESYYPVLVTLEMRENLRIGETGEIHFRGPWRSKLVSLGKYLISLFIQESGF